MANTLEIIIKATDNASRVLKDVSDSAGGLGSSFLSLGRGALGVATVAGGALVAGVGAAGTALAAMAISAMPLQGIKLAFEGITDSSDATMAALREASLGMVTDRELMMSYNEAAQLVSTTFADQLPEAMGYLNQVAAATGQDTSFMMTSLIRGVGRMSPLILDNLGIQVDLAQATERASEMFGKQADELSKDELQAGMMNVVLEALAENTKDMPDIAGTATQSWGALATTMANLKDNVGLALLPALTDLGAKVSEFVASEQFQGWMQRAIALASMLAEKFIAIVGFLMEGDLAGALGTIFSSDAVDKIMAVVTAVSAFVTQIATFVGEHSEEFKAALIAIGAVLAGSAIAAAISFIGVAIAAINWPITLLIGAIALLSAAWAGNWLGIRTALTDVWAAMEPVLQIIWEWLSTNVPVALAALKADFDEVLGAIKVVWDIVWPYLSDVISAVWTVIQTTVTTAIGIIQGIIATVTALIKGDWEGAWLAIQGIVSTYLTGIATILGTWLDTFLGWFGTSREDIVAVVSGMWADVTMWFETAKTNLTASIIGIKDSLGTEWSAFKENTVTTTVNMWAATKVAFDDAQMALDTAMGDIVGFLGGDWEAFKEETVLATDDMWSQVKDSFDAALTTLDTAIGDIVELLGGDWTAFKDDIVLIAEELWADVKAAFELAKTDLGLLVSNIVTDIKALFTDVDWGAIGTGIIDGIKLGVSNAASSLGDAARSAAESALNAVKDFLGIGSPSKVFQGIGENMIEGLILGIQHESGKLAGVMNNLFAAAGIMSGLGNAAVAVIRRDTLDPLQTRIEEIDAMLQEIEDRRIAEGGLDWMAQAAQNALIAERARITEQIAAEEERILALQKQQQDLAYLQQQMRLVEMIAEYGLNPEEILGGLQLGENADASALLEAMTRAMEAIVKQISDTLASGAGVPGLAGGAIVRQPMLAMIAEKGPEAVIPLSDLQGAGDVQNFYLTANYRYQDEHSLRDDLAMLQMLGGRA